MRTTEHCLDLPLGSAPAAPRLGLTGMLKSVWQMIVKRRSIAELSELEEHQLRDIGLTRGDVREAMTSAFFDDVSGHLTQAARKRANAYYRDARRD